MSNKVVNAVPSLDDLLKEFEESNYANDVNTYNEFLKDKLQNGVETK